jgi:hypothetical protein
MRSYRISRNVVPRFPCSGRPTSAGSGGMPPIAMFKIIFNFAASTRRQRNRSESASSRRCTHTHGADAACSVLLSPRICTRIIRHSMSAPTSASQLHCTYSMVKEPCWHAPPSCPSRYPENAHTLLLSDRLPLVLHSPCSG